MAITTIRAHVNRALDFFGKESTFFAIGRTTPWPNDLVGNTEIHVNFSPPLEDPSLPALEELVGYKKVETKHMVRPVANGETADITYRDEGWKIVTPANAVAQGARWVYISATILYDEIPLGFYRQVGVYTGLTRKAGVSASKYALIPNEVENAGVLEVLDNRQPSNRQIDSTEKLSLVLEF